MLLKYADFARCSNFSGKAGLSEYKSNPLGGDIHHEMVSLSRFYTPEEGKAENPKRGMHQKDGYPS